MPVTGVTTKPLWPPSQFRSNPGILWRLRNLIRVAPDSPHVNFQLLFFAKHPPALCGSIGFFWKRGGLSIQLILSFRPSNTALISRRVSFSNLPLLKQYVYIYSTFLIQNVLNCRILNIFFARWSLRRNQSGGATELNDADKRFVLKYGCTFGNVFIWTFDE